MKKNESLLHCIAQVGFARSSLNNELVAMQVLVAVENYGVLGNELSMARDLPAAQVESLELLFRAMTNTL